jgi:gluconolactonase
MKKLTLILLLLPGLAVVAAAETTKQGVGFVWRGDPAAMEQIIARDAPIEKIGGGFTFTEGPIWFKEGYLLFSDVVGNVIRKWTPDGKVVEFKRPAGYDGTDAPAGAFIGSNGMTLDKEGNLYICEHGNHRIEKMDKSGKYTVVVDKYEGKRLNSPNDLVFKSDGSLYFTDPPYGLIQQDQDPKKELKFNGIYRLKGGKLTLLNKDMTRPNGLAFSPDEKYLYVSNSDEKKKIWMRFDVKPDGTLGKGQVFYDVTSMTAEGLPDGMKVDTKGNLYCSGPGGVWVFSPEGKHLGTIQPPETPANCAFGEDGKTLFITARTGLYRVKVNIPGIRPE